VTRPWFDEPGAGQREAATRQPGAQDVVMVWLPLVSLAVEFAWLHDALTVGPLWAGDLVARCSVAAVIGIATGTYHCVERPWLKRFDASAKRMQRAWCVTD
jgi:peptidoglycan/LPS O-acetylase OafA/YrhL